MKVTKTISVNIVINHLQEHNIYGSILTQFIMVVMLTKLMVVKFVENVFLKSRN